MGSMRTPVLRAFDGVYQIAGGARGLAEIHEGTPIQPVADLNRMAEIGSGKGAFWGFVNLTLATDHNAVTTAFATFDPYSAAVMATLQARSEEVWCWLLACSERHTASLTISSALLGVQQVAITGAITDHMVPVALWTTESAAFISGAPDDLGFSVVQSLVPFPFLITPGSTLGFRGTTTVAGAAGTAMRAQLLVWYGPRGTLPPGLY